MSCKSPVYPTPDSQHFSDYGFDPLTHCFESLEEARKHKSGFASSPDGFHFKLKKFVSADQETKARKKKTWWGSALFFWKRSSRSQETSTAIFALRNQAVSRPIPILESDREIEATLRRRRDWSGSIGRSTPTSKYVERENPYVSLGELNRLSSSSSSSCS